MSLYKMTFEPIYTGCSAYNWYTRRANLDAAWSITGVESGISNSLLLRGAGASLQAAVDRTLSVELPEDSVTSAQAHAFTYADSLRE